MKFVGGFQKFRESPLKKYEFEKKIKI